MNGPRKVRTLIAELRQLGCTPERTRGSHQTWRSPRGARFVIVVNHRNADASPVVLAVVRRVLRAELSPMPASGGRP